MVNSERIFDMFRFVPSFQKPKLYKSEIIILENDQEMSDFSMFLVMVGKDSS